MRGKVKVDLKLPRGESSWRGILRRGPQEGVEGGPAPAATILSTRPLGCGCQVSESPRRGLVTPSTGLPIVSDRANPIWNSCAHRQQLSGSGNLGKFPIQPIPPEKVGGSIRVFGFMLTRIASTRTVISDRSVNELAVWRWRLKRQHDFVFSDGTGGHGRGHMGRCHRRPRQRRLFLYRQCIFAEEHLVPPRPAYE